MTERESEAEVKWVLLQPALIYMFLFSFLLKKKHAITFIIGDE
jgi:hypothetical protein